MQSGRPNVARSEYGTLQQRKERKQAASMIEALVKERDEAIEEKNRGEI